MVVALGPGRFYGSGLPRPRFYSDVKLGGARVDPPRPVMDPLLSWAHEAHWSMGGLSFVRRRLQGRIEGSVSKLRRRLQRRSSPRKAPQKSLPVLDSDYDDSSDSQEEVGGEVVKDVTFDDDDEEESDADKRRGRRKRKLGDEFDRIAGAQVAGGIGRRTRSRRAEVEIGETSLVPPPSPTYTVSEKGKRKQKKVDAGVVRRTSLRKKHL
ncbi:uncharacterized protein LOC109727021 [Ananas comosus]|uniref:Uncharacterized protein LOC109727021 n=1 Tax=Ananas comosus TaxID=4615 RepID=A0A199UUD4_ANACO|nr:uncharacterized protein LOC109727021 [Ananas comosus]OAY68398.1 hypothetical protein ACMD2_22894 [Ananas comosus]